MSRPIRTILCDIDGTLIFKDRPIPGAARAVSEMRSRGLKLRFLTNTSSLPPQAIADKLSGFGFDIGGDEIETSVSACASLLAQRPERSVWLLVPDAVRHLFDRNPQDADHPDDVVVTDVHHGFTYAAMNEAYLKLAAGARLVVPHRNMYWYKGPEKCLDAGVYIAGLEVATGQTAVLTGKPAPAFFREALRAVGGHAGEALIVGDDCLTDVRGAIACGIRSLLVETGKNAAPDRQPSSLTPTHTLASIADLPAFLETLSSEEMRDAAETLV